MTAEATVLSGVIDAAVEAGGDAAQIESITTDLSASVRTQATNEARKLAVADGMSIGATLADAAGVKLGAVFAIVDQPASGGGGPVPYVAAGYGGAADMAMAKSSTPITIGSTQVVASVSIQWALQ